MNRAEAMSDEIARWKSSGLSLMAYAKQSAVSYKKRSDVIYILQRVDKQEAKRGT